jgi:hypothetical protein
MACRPAAVFAVRLRMVRGYGNLLILFVSNLPHFLFRWIWKLSILDSQGVAQNLCFQIPVKTSWVFNSLLSTTVFMDML